MGSRSAGYLFYMAILLAVFVLLTITRAQQAEPEPIPGPPAPQWGYGAWTPAECPTNSCVPFAQTRGLYCVYPDGSQASLFMCEGPPPRDLPLTQDCPVTQCENGGVCDRKQTRQCVCAQDWTGPDCSLRTSLFLSNVVVPTLVEAAETFDMTWDAEGPETMIEIILQASPDDEIVILESNVPSSRGFASIVLPSETTPTPIGQRVLIALRTPDGNTVPNSPNTFVVLYFWQPSGDWSECSTRICAQGQQYRAASCFSSEDGNPVNPSMCHRSDPPALTRNCKPETTCQNDGQCDQVSDVCICSGQWSGDLCTEPVSTTVTNVVVSPDQIDIGTTHAAITWDLNGPDVLLEVIYKFSNTEPPVVLVPQQPASNQHATFIIPFGTAAGGDATIGLRFLGSSSFTPSAPNVHTRSFSWDEGAPWSECSTSICASGEQTRVVSCFETGSGVPALVQQCDPLTQPPLTRACQPPIGCQNQGRCDHQHDTCICTSLFSGSFCDIPKVQECSFEVSPLVPRSFQASHRRKSLRDSSHQRNFGPEFQDHTLKPKCKNRGFVAINEDLAECEDNCTCPGNWVTTADIPSPVTAQNPGCNYCNMTCSTPSMSPTNSPTGFHDDSCFDCLCEIGFWGPACSCSEMYLTLSFDYYPRKIFYLENDRLQRFLWSQRRLRSGDNLDHELAREAIMEDIGATLADSLGEEEPLEAVHWTITSQGDLRITYRVLKHCDSAAASRALVDPYEAIARLLEGLVDGSVDFGDDLDVAVPERLSDLIYDPTCLESQFPPGSNYSCASGSSSPLFVEGDRPEVRPIPPQSDAKSLSLILIILICCGVAIFLLLVIAVIIGCLYCWGRGPFNHSGDSRARRRQAEARKRRRATTSAPASGYNPATGGGSFDPHRSHPVGRPAGTPTPDHRGRSARREASAGPPSVSRTPSRKPDIAGRLRSANLNHSTAKPPATEANQHTVDVLRPPPPPVRQPLATIPSPVQEP